MRGFLHHEGRMPESGAPRSRIGKTRRYRASRHAGQPRTPSVRFCEDVLDLVGDGVHVLHAVDRHQFARLLVMRG
jgi:hypothetical protein